jgi:hypothetical protein
MKEIILDFDPEGEVKIEGKGFQGKECDKEMLFLEIALGVETGRKKKPEYFQAVATNARQRA